MTVQEIIEALTPYSRKFPEAAMREAKAQQEEVTPHLLRVLEEVAEDPGKFRPDENMLPWLGAYLLAQFRERRAYRSLLKILAAPGKLADLIFGDTLTSHMAGILASVYDGDPEPLKRLVENRDAYEWSRTAALGTFMVLAHTGQMPRQEVVDYYRELFTGKLERENSHVWDELASAVADFPAPELVDEMRRAFEDGLTNPWFAGLEDLEAEAAVPFEQKPEWRKERFQLISDPIAELSSWAAFNPDPPRAPAPPLQSFEPPPPLEPYQPADPPRGKVITAGTSAVRQAPKIGRNDPCPCGSGKKYKKCCLGK